MDFQIYKNKTYKKTLLWDFASQHPTKPRFKNKIE